MNEKTVEMKGITKRFPNTLANDHIDLELSRVIRIYFPQMLEKP